MDNGCQHGKWKKSLRKAIYSTIRWASDMSYDMSDAIGLRLPSPLSSAFSRSIEWIPFLRSFCGDLAGYAGHGPPVTVIYGRLITAVSLVLSVLV
jgi:hypothetical protein